MTAQPSSAQAGGDARRGAGDERSPAGTNGAPLGTDGTRRKAFWSGAAGVAAIAACVCVVNALSTLADNTLVERWEPWVWEATSAVVVISLVWVPWIALMRAPPEGSPWPRLILTHLAAALVFSILHVAGFVALREAAYAFRGWDYDFGVLGVRFPYELRKDLLSYLALAATFWVALRLTDREARSGTASPTFDIRDGARIIRVSADQIIAVTAAGNYAEFVLGDGRRPLMRATLARLEAELAPLGLIRAHRSWLVNPAHLTGLAPDGSGDWTVELGDIRAPVSRRYPAALERLKG